jgi:TonB family protein
MRSIVAACFLVGCGTAPALPVARPAPQATEKAAASQAPAATAVEPVVIPEAEPQDVEVPAAALPAPPNEPAPVARALPALPAERPTARHRWETLRLCYERGLLSQPDLEGRVVVRFVIERDGSVSGARDGGSDLPDAQVVACVVEAFGRLRFPAPEGGGRVTVSYPIIFTPGD